MRFAKFASTITFLAFCLLEGVFFTGAVQVASAEDVLKRTLRATHLRTEGPARNASCKGPGCIANEPAFDPPELTVPCTGGPSCTYELTFCGVFLFLDDSAAGDALFVRFRVDGVNPLPGPTGPGGIVFLQSPVPTEARIDARCFNVVSANNDRGDHTIEVEFGAINAVGGATSVWLREATLRVDAYIP